MQDQPIRVLLIEDNPGDIRLIEEMLKESMFPPCEFEQINNLHEREEIAEKTFDIILLDLHFDDMTGTETYSYANLYFPLTPIVVLTGLQDERLAHEIVKRGAQDYLLKDAIEPKGLIRSIRYAIERKKAEIQKDEFLGFASHELKTPVTSIKAYIQLAQLYAHRNQQAEQHPYDLLPLIQKVEAQVDRLTHLINDLLDVTKVQAGKLEFTMEDFAIDEVVHEVVGNMQITAQKHHIVIEGQTSVKVHGDRERTAQILINLLSNAIKYSPQADCVVVRLALSYETVSIAIQDYGIGISKENQQKIFERFYRVHGVNQETYPGLGLGLHIAAEIAKRQNGKLSVESTEGKGSIFCLELPVAHAQKQEESQIQ
jgi:signal transduction histidine kinase